MAKHARLVTAFNSIRVSAARLLIEEVTHLCRRCRPGLLSEEKLYTCEVPTLSGKVQRLPSSLERRSSKQPTGKQRREIERARGPQLYLGAGASEDCGQSWCN